MATNRRQANTVIPAFRRVRKHRDPGQLETVQLEHYILNTYPYRQENHNPSQSRASYLVVSLPNTTINLEHLRLKGQWRGHKLLKVSGTGRLSLSPWKVREPTSMKSQHDRLNKTSTRKPDMLTQKGETQVGPNLRQLQKTKKCWKWQRSLSWRFSNWSLIPKWSVLTLYTQVTLYRRSILLYEHINIKSEAVSLRM